MVLLVPILIVSLFQHSSASNEISRAEVRNRFPLLRHVDRFSQCLGDEAGVYCSASIEFVAEGPNELYDTMRNYSHSRHHLNHMKANYGYCMTRRCREWYRGGAGSLEGALGACLNHSLEREHGLRARVLQYSCHSHHAAHHSVTLLDRVAALLLLALIMLTVVGTFYDLLVTNKDPKSYLMCFSVPANWSKLTAPWPQDKMTARLIGLNGIRTMTTISIITIHGGMIVDYLENMNFLEDMNNNVITQILLHSSIIMQTFFLLSGLLLSFTTQVSRERNPKSWRYLPKAILLRWLRLAVVPYSILLFSLTWFKFASPGPFWEEIVNRQHMDCHRNWHFIFLFFQNYIKNAECNLQLWSTAVDMHLQIMGLTVLYLSPTRGVRNAVLWALLFIGVALPAVETYAKDLDGAFLVGPQYSSSFISCILTWSFPVLKIYFKLFKAAAPRIFIADKTHANLFRRSHTNMPSFIIGMLLGHLLYEWQKNPIDFTKYKKYTVLYWMLIPVLLFLSFANTFLITADGGRAPMSTRLLFALARNPAWGMTLAILIIGMVYQVERGGVYRRLLEWGGWVPLMRLSYCAYNVHPIIILWMVGGSLTLYTGSVLIMGLTSAGVICITFPLAAVWWLLVEAPAANLVMKFIPDKKSILMTSDNKKE